MTIKQKIKKFFDEINHKHKFSKIITTNKEIPIIYYCKDCNTFFKRIDK